MIFPFTRQYKFTSLLKETSSNSESVFAQREEKVTVRRINDLMMIVYYLYYSSV